MNILSLGNSFSQDAQRYLHEIAREDGVELNSFNLCIAGCPLSRHYDNMISKENAYFLEINGVWTDLKVSMDEILLARKWDVITLQQASRFSPNYDTYQPYLNSLAEHIRKLVPNAKIVIHQTWAYEQGSELLNKVLEYNDYKDMLNDIMNAYNKAQSDISADFIIPSGEVLDALLKNGIEKVHRDTFHASLGLGRYAVALTWYRFITGNDIMNSQFSNFEEPVADKEIALVKKCVLEIANKYGK